MDTTRFIPIIGSKLQEIESSLKFYEGDDQTGDYIYWIPEGVSISQGKIPTNRVLFSADPILWNNKSLGDESSLVIGGKLSTFLETWIKPSGFEVSAFKAKEVCITFPEAIPEPGIPVLKSEDESPSDKNYIARELSPLKAKSLQQLLILQKKRLSSLEEQFDELNIQLSTPPKINVLKPFKDDFELVGNFQATDYISLKQLSQGYVGEEVSTLELGPIYLYDKATLGESGQVSDNALKFQDTETSDILWDLKSSKRVYSMSPTLPEGCLIKLTLLGLVIPTSLIYLDEDPVLYANQVCYWLDSETDERAKGKCWETVFIKAEPSVVKTKYFLIDIDSERLIIYPKDTQSVKEYRVVSAKLVNVL